MAIKPLKPEINAVAASYAVIVTVAAFWGFRRKAEMGLIATESVILGGIRQTKRS
jgi:hypothetical protein